LRRRSAAAEIPDEMLRFGVEFADGRRATNTGGGVFRVPTPSRNGLSCVRVGAAAGAVAGIK
jgi:hypothetical protein